MTRTNDGTGQWLRERCGRYPIPGKAEQITLGRAIREWQDWPGGPEAAPEEVRRAGLAARDRMVSGNMRLVFAEMRRFERTGQSEDLEQCAMFGLMRAAEKFDPARGYTFATYARSWIQQAITRALPTVVSSVRVPESTRNLVVRARNIAEELRHELGREPTTEEVAARLKGTMKRTGDSLREMCYLYQRANAVRSLDQAVLSGGEDRSPLLDLLPAAGEDPLEAVEERQMRESLQMAMSLCSPEDLDILRRRLAGETLASIGEDYGYGREKIRRQCEKVQERLRHLLAEDFVKIQQAV